MGELSYRTLRENVVTEIRLKILRGELKPGMRIVEQTLSREFGISRGPIREALRQLEQEGLIRYTRNAGCTVKEISTSDMYEIYLLRCTLECTSIRECGGIFSAADLSEMEQILEEMRALREGDLQSLVLCDHRLHRILVQKAGLPRLSKIWEDLNYGSYIAGTHSGPYRSNLTQRQYIIHRDLVDVLRTGDVEAICRKLEEHYLAPLRRVMEDTPPTQTPPAPEDTSPRNLPASGTGVQP